MATLLDGIVKVTIQPNYGKALDLSTARDIVASSGEASWDLAFGTAANQANMVWHDQRTLADSATEELDLSGGLTDAFGDSITLARVKAIFIKTNAASVANLQVGGAAANAFINWVGDATDKLIVRGAGGFFMTVGPDATGFAVTAATGDLLKITHDGSDTADIVYDIIVIGSGT